ncbi:MAG: ABC transporter permease [Thermoplasmata archaeon]|nr:MAG: ABC transporter permease [Thermoplasmata archaeon]
MSGLGIGALILFVLFLITVAGVLGLGILQPQVVTIAIRSLRGHAKTNLALIAATCISTLVITGSLISGDSLRASITDAAYDNLGEVDEIITSDRLFSGSILDSLMDNNDLMDDVDHLAPIIYMKGIAESPSTGARTTKANLIGINEAFFEFGSMLSVEGIQLDFSLGINEVFINEDVASEIGVGKGEKINISFARLDQVFEAIFLGEQKNTNLKVQLEVKDVVSSEGMGRFQLNANRNTPQNIYVNIESLQLLFNSEDSMNMILVSNTGDEREGEKLCNDVSKTLRSALDDAIGYEEAGFRLLQNTGKNYLALESADIFFSYDYLELISNHPSITTLKATSQILTYFWNTLSLGDRYVPYSTITAFDPNLDNEFGLFTLNGSTQEIEGSLAEDEIIINNWVAERLQADVEDTVAMNYSVMDEFYNIRYLTKNFTVKYIVDMQGKADDRMLMPSFPGIEGKMSAFDWDPPFPMNLDLITNDDERYWQDYEGTPKAFIGFAQGTNLWNTDIGNITQVRMIPKQDSSLSELTQQVEDILNNFIGADEASISIKAVKLDALESAQGIDIFTQMFLAFSAACIIAAAVLIVLLITLRIESRMTENATLRALGFRKRSINHIFLVEGTILSIVGGVFGVILGLLFGVFLITGMNTFWSSIMEGSQVRFYYTLDSLVVGFSLGILISIFTMFLALWYEGRRTVAGALRYGLSAREEKKSIFLPSFFGIIGLIILVLPVLIGNGFQSELGFVTLGLGPVILIFSARGFIGIRHKKNIEFWAGLALVIYTLILTSYFADIVPVIELFFISGFMLLCGFILVFHHFLVKVTWEYGKEEKEIPIQHGKRWLLQFSIKNAARRPKRTMFSVFLFSLTLFVLVSLTINLQGAIYDVEKAVSESGGGYQIMGEGVNPIFADLADSGSRQKSGISSNVFNELEITQFKTKGDLGGTCSNLNRAASPRLIGANKSFFWDNSFVFINHEDLGDGEDNPWLLLQESKEDDEIPAIGDYNTIVWILGLDLGSTITIVDEMGNTVSLKIVGIIGNSIFQGSLIIWDENFDVLYPTDNGYDLFLFKSEASNLKPQMTELESALSAYGFDAYSVESVVVENILIENTYISIFQVILLFGLIIGTLGFGIVAARNTLERRREMGILRAIGFSKGTLMKSLFLENSYVILSGIIIGTLSGIIASSVYLLRMNIDFGSWPWLYVAGILLISYIVAMISALIPILKASKMEVSNAIRTSE